MCAYSVFNTFPVYPLSAKPLILLAFCRYRYHTSLFNRPAFQRMIADIEAGKIGCVITKDLSRLGRNYIEAGSYIEIFFPKHNVRYIAITDGVDSLTRQEMDITPFKNILNDMYSRDISKKVLAGITTRSRQGKFCGGTPPFGLMRDPEDKGHLILDPETAPVIRKIYDMALDSLISTIGRCEEYSSDAKELGCEGEISDIQAKAEEALEAFKIDTEKALEVYDMKDRTAYSKEIYQILDDAGLSEE